MLKINGKTQNMFIDKDPKSNRDFKCRKNFKAKRATITSKYFSKILVFQ